MKKKVHGYFCETTTAYPANKSVCILLIGRYPHSQSPTSSKQQAMLAADQHMVKYSRLHLYHQLQPALEAR